MTASTSLSAITPIDKSVFLPYKEEIYSIVENDIQDTFKDVHHKFAPVVIDRMTTILQNWKDHLLKAIKHGRFRITINSTYGAYNSGIYHSINKRLLEIMTAVFDEHCGFYNLSISYIKARIGRFPNIISSDILKSGPEHFEVKVSWTPDNPIYREIVGII